MLGGADKLNGELQSYIIGANSFGNLIAERRGEYGALTTYEYDCRHRLIKHTTPNGTVTTCTYDAFNRRLSKTHNGETTLFVWQGTRLVAQGSEDCAQWQTFIYEPGTHRPLALVDGHKYRHPHKLKPKVYWYQNDHPGTPRSLTDTQGRTVYRCRYTAYGKLLDETFFTDERTGLPLINVKNPLRFQGQYEDDESGLFYNLNRYYDPTTGRYLTQDPIKLAGGLNPYAYVDGNPVSWIDPLGLKGGPGFGTNPTGDRIPEPEIKRPKGDLYIPRDSNGNPIPLDKQKFEGQDIPLPHPDAEGRAHTTLGGKMSTKTGDVYRQTAEFPADTWPLADGKPVPLSEVHWGDHGTPHHHPYNPHQHPFIFNGKIWLRAKSNRTLPFDTTPR